MAAVAVSWSGATCAASSALWVWISHWPGPDQIVSPREIPARSAAGMLIPARSGPWCRTFCHWPESVLRFTMPWLASEIQDQIHRPRRRCFQVVDHHLGSHAVM